jgi:hypothetical protein
LVDGVYPNIYLISNNAKLYRQNGGRPLKIFISSTVIDLQEYRQVAIEVINRYKVVVPLGAGFVNGESQDPEVVDEKSIRDCDVFIGIYAHRCGYIPEGQDKSVTQQEYELAGKLGKECLFFVVDNNYPWSPKFIDWEKHQQLQDFLSKVKKETTVSFFTSPSDFKNTFSTTLGKVLQSKSNSA